MTDIIIYLMKIIWLSTKRFFRERYSLYVSALTFSTLLSIVPLLSISVFCLTIFPFFSRYIIITNNYLYQNLIPSSAATIQIYLQDFSKQATHLPILSILFLVIAVLMMINTIDDVINDIWNIHINRRKLSIWLFYSLILLIAPILFGVGVFSISYIFSTYLTPLSSFLFIISPLFINTIVLSLFYIYTPNTYIKKSAAFLGGFIAALLVEATKILFAFWFSYFSNYKLIYGVFAILPIFLVWIYFCWFIVLWGAILTYALNTYSRKDLINNTYSQDD